MYLGPRRAGRDRNAPAKTSQPAAPVVIPEPEPQQPLLLKRMQVNFDELHVAAISNHIHVYEASRLTAIDVSAPLGFPAV